MKVKQKKVRTSSISKKKKDKEFGSKIPRPDRLRKDEEETLKKEQATFLANRKREKKNIG